jgi:DNA-binding IclR family transcriptional regulator
MEICFELYLITDIIKKKRKDNKMEKKTTTRSLERALDIIECFIDNDKELSLMEISEITNLSPSTVHRLINSLLERGFVARSNANKKFFLGPKIAVLGSSSRYNMSDNFKEIAKEYMVELRDKDNENVSLYLLDGDYKLCIERVMSSRSLRQIINIGDRVTIEKGSTGRVFLAHCSEEKLMELKQKYPEIDLNKVFETRIKGYAFSKGEREEGLVGIAAPIYDVEGKLKAVLSLSGPSIRFLNENLSEKIKDTIEVAKKISKAIGYQESEKLNKKT